MTPADRVRPVHAVRPLRWWNEATLAQLARRLDEAWQSWCAGWGFESGAVRCWNASAAPQLYDTVRHWSHAGVLATDGLWLGVAERAPADWIRRGAFDVAAEGQTTPIAPIADRVALDAWRDLQHTLACAVGAEASAEAPEAATGLPAGHRLPWSGAVAVRLALAHGPLDAVVVHLGPGAAAHGGERVPRAVVAKASCEPLTPVAEALGQRPVTLAVHLSEVDIELGMLQSLQTGDVVMLSHALEQPATVRWADVSRQGETPTLFHGHLGRVGPRKAIAVHPLRPITSTS